MSQVPSLSNTLPTLHNHSALQECIDEALLDGPRLIQQWLQTLADHLVERQANAANHKEGQAWRHAHETLQMTRGVIQGLWVKNWHHSMGRGGPYDGTAASLEHPPAHSGALRFDALESMNQDQIQAKIEAARFEQSVLIHTRSTFELWLRRLNRTLPTTQHIAPTSHPLRPEITIQSLVYTLETVCPDNKARINWLKAGVSAWEEQLKYLYHLLDQVLDQQGSPLMDEGIEVSMVELDQLDQLDQINQFHQLSQPKEAEQLPQHKHAPSKEPRGRDSQITLKELYELMVSDSLDPPSHSAAPRMPAASTLSPPAPVAAPVTSPPQTTSAPKSATEPTSTSPPPPIQRERRRRARHGNGELTDVKALHLTDLAEEVVGMMLDSMTNDPRLLAPVVQELQQLRPALLQAAREEPRFFADKHNPARRLLDELTLRSLAHSTTTTPRFQAYFRQVRQTLSTLNTTKDTSASARFTKALHTLTALADQNQKESQIAQDQSQAVTTLLRAEQRYLLTDKVRKEIAARSDIASATPEVLAFIYGPWTQVIADARLASQTHPCPDSVATEQRYVKLLSHLIWICNPALTAQNPPLLIKTTPSLLRFLREGLQRINFSPNDTQRFLQHLTGQCEKALKNQPDTSLLATIRKAIDSEPLSPAHLAPDQPLASAKPNAHPHSGPHTHANATSNWIAGIGAAAGGTANSFGKADFAETQPLPPPLETETTPKETALLPDLKMGAWVEIDYPDGMQRRAQVSWISPHGTMYLFKEGTGQTISLSKFMCQSLFTQRRLRVIAMNSMVDDALNTVTAQAIRNSVIRQ